MGLPWAGRTSSPSSGSSQNRVVLISVCPITWLICTELLELPWILNLPALPFPWLHLRKITPFPWRALPWACQTLSSWSGSPHNRVVLISVYSIIWLEYTELVELPWILNHPAIHFPRFHHKIITSIPWRDLPWACRISFPLSASFHNRVLLISVYPTTWFIYTELVELPWTLNPPAIHFNFTRK